MVIDGDADQFAIWIDTHALPITVPAGHPRVASVVIATAGGEIAIGSESG